MKSVSDRLISSADLDLDLFRQNGLHKELWMKVNICQYLRFFLSHQYSSGCICFISERVQFPSLMGFHWTWVSHEYCLSRSRKHWIWSSVRHCCTLQGNVTSFSENSIHVIYHHHQNNLHQETLYTEKKFSLQKQPWCNTLNILIHRNLLVLTYWLTMNTLKYCVTSQHYVSTFPTEPTYAYELDTWKKTWIYSNCYSSTNIPTTYIIKIWHDKSTQNINTPTQLPFNIFTFY
jgi:hypothetical protein